MLTAISELRKFTRFSATIPTLTPQKRIGGREKKIAPVSHRRNSITISLIATSH
jgi:hypothetical protein